MGEEEEKRVFLSSVSARDEALPKAINKLTHCRNLNGNVGARQDLISCFSSVLSLKKNLDENESIDWILSVAFKEMHAKKKKKVSKSPKGCFPLYSFWSKIGSQNGDLTKESISQAEPN